LSSNGNFTIFSSLLQVVTDLNTTLTSGGPYTLIAPTGEAEEWGIIIIGGGGGGNRRVVVAVVVAVAA